MQNENDQTDNTAGSFTLEQYSILIGSLLGDGSLRRQGGKKNALFEVNHSYQYKDYVDWKYKVFQSYVLMPPKCRRGNGKRIAYRFTTRSIPIFTKFYLNFYRRGKKVIPKDITFNPLILAVWFMDDGSKSRSSYYLNTQQFDSEDQEFMIESLKRDFDIDARVNKDKIYSRLRVTTASSRLLEQLIFPYILPCFRYKLGDNPVTTDPKGEALIIEGNTPSLVISQESLWSNPKIFRQDEDIV